MVDHLVQQDGGEEVVGVAQDGDVDQHPLAVDDEGAATGDGERLARRERALPEVGRIDVLRQQPFEALVVAIGIDRPAVGEADADVGGRRQAADQIAVAFGGLIVVVGEADVAAQHRRVGVELQFAANAMHRVGDGLRLALDENVAEFLVVEPVVGEDDADLQGHGQSGEGQDASGHNGGQADAAAADHGSTIRIR